MNYSAPQDNARSGMKRERGLTLIEVLLTMVIFATGMLALAHLQNNLTRSSVEANTRTVAANVGEEIIERLRAFQLLTTDPAGLADAYEDITATGVSQSVPRGGIIYTVTGMVKDYDFDADRQNVTEFTPATGQISDFKVVELTVSWDNNTQFIIDSEGPSGQQISSNDMGTGSITIKELIPSIPALAAAKVAARDDGALGGPIVDYTPGLNPDVVAINLENSKFKESTTLVPDVIRIDQFVETWFDVITYSQVTPEAILLRREEFLNVSCSCTLRFPSGGTPTGFLPTVWSGVDYTEGEFVSKPYGESASNQQSRFCDTCCRDHHDGAAGKSGKDQVYDPHRTWTAPNNKTVDHEHYSRSKQGAFSLATADGDGYVEACRMIRKDGFMRVSQDFRQEKYYTVPASSPADPTVLPTAEPLASGARGMFVE